VEDDARKGELLTLLSEEIRQRRGSSAVFMLIVADFIVLALLSVIYAVFLAPVWSEMMESFGAELPAPTRFAFLLGRILAILAVVGVFAAIALRVGSRLAPHGVVLDFMDRALRRIPPIDAYARTSLSVRWARCLSIGSLAPGGIARAMAEAGGRSARGRAAARLARELDHHGLAEAMARTDAFLPGFVNLVRAQEQRGALAQSRSLLGRYATVTANREDSSLDRMLLTAHFVTAIIVCIFVIGFYLPIFKLGSIV
jgi:type IV pilus assembly protein PilC